jgi:hypothetical protein
MTLFYELQTLFPYLQSVRKLKNYLSFDIEFPNTWKLPKKFINEESTVELKTDKPNIRLFSFVSEFNEETVNNVLNSIKSVISYNKEREEKERLFTDKVNELKKIFDSSDLDNLQTLKFELIKDKITFDDGGDEDTIRNGDDTELVQG